MASHSYILISLGPNRMSSALAHVRDYHPSDGVPAINEQSFQQAPDLIDVTFQPLHCPDVKCNPSVLGTCTLPLERHESPFCFTVASSRDASEEIMGWLWPWRVDWKRK